MILFAYLAGMSFVIAIAAIWMGVAERKRARKAEQAFQLSLQLLDDQHERHAVLIVQLSQQSADLLHLIKALAGTPEPSSATHGIMVPGPRRLQ